MVKIVMAVLALLNAGWMVFDGFHVIRKGKYFGPEKPGPWVMFPEAIGLDPLKIGPLFILIGFSWLTAAVMIFINTSLSHYIVMVPALLTLWYIPIGSIISLVYIVLFFLKF